MSTHRQCSCQQKQLATQGSLTVAVELVLLVKHAVGALEPHRFQRRREEVGPRARDDLLRLRCVWRGVWRDTVVARQEKPGCFATETAQLASSITHSTHLDGVCLAARVDVARLNKLQRLQKDLEAGASRDGRVGGALPAVRGLRRGSRRGGWATAEAGAASSAGVHRGQST